MVIPLPLFWLWRLRYICCCLLWYTLHQPSSTSCFDMSIKTFCLHQMTVISYAMMIFACINSLWHMLWRCVPWLCNINNLLNFRHYVNKLWYLDEYIWSYALYNQFGAKNGILYPPHRMMFQSNIPCFDHPIYSIHSDSGIHVVFFNTHLVAQFQAVIHKTQLKRISSIFDKRSLMTDTPTPIFLREKSCAYEGSLQKAAKEFVLWKLSES